MTTLGQSEMIFLSRNIYPGYHTHTFVPVWVPYLFFAKNCIHTISQTEEEDLKNKNSFQLQSSTKMNQLNKLYTKTMGTRPPKLLKNTGNHTYTTKLILQL